MRSLAIGMLALIVGLGSASSAASADAAPTDPASLLAKITDAYGGGTVLQSIKTQIVVVSALVSGQNATVTNTFAAPDRFLAQVVVPAFHATLLAGFDGKTAWGSDAYGNVEALSGAKEQEVRCQAIESNPNNGTSGDAISAINFEPGQTIDGKSYLVLSVTPPGCPQVVDYVDPASYLVVRAQTAGLTLTFSGFKKGPSGETYPGTIVQSGPQGIVVSTVTSVQDNAAVDPSMFTMPSTPSPAPTVAPSPSP